MRYRARCVRYRQGDRARRLRVGTAGSGPLGPRARVPRPGGEGPAGTEFAAATSWSAWCAVRTPCRAGRAHTASSTCAATAATPNAASRSSTGTAATSWTRGNRITLCALDPRLARVGVLLEPTSVVAKAWEQIDEIGRRSLVRAPPGAGHRRRADRTARGAASATQQGTRDARSRPRHRRTETRPRRAGSAPPTTTATSATSSASAPRTSWSRRPGRAPVVFDAMAGTRRLRHHVPDRGVAGGADDQRRRRALNRDIVLENDADRRVGQRQPAALPRRRRCARQGRPRLAGRLITRRVPLRDAQHAFDRRATTTSRSSSTSRTPPR